MSKIYIHTYDVFDISDPYKRQKMFTKCSKVALKCGLELRSVMKEGFISLELSGSKYQFVKYYIRTISVNENGMNCVKRILDIIKTK